MSLLQYSRTIEKTPFARPMVVPVALTLFLTTDKHGSPCESYMSGLCIKSSVIVPISGSRRSSGYSNSQLASPQGNIWL